MRTLSFTEKLEWYARCKNRSDMGLPEYDASDPEPLEEEVEFPQHIADAIKIFRHKLIERYAGNSPNKEPAANESRRIADGWIDKRKQNAFYVGLWKTGLVSSEPNSIRREDAWNEVERAKRFAEGFPSITREYFALQEILATVFDPPAGLGLLR